MVIGEYSNTVVTVTASGKVELTWTPAAAPYSGKAGEFTPTGRMSWAGPTGQAQVSLLLAPIGGAWTAIWLATDNQPTTTKQLRLNGRYVAYRNPDGRVSITQTCGTGTPPWTADCVTYSKTQTVTVRRVPAQMSLTANHSTVPPGTMVTFKAKPTADSIGSPKVKTPFAVKEWRFVEDSGKSVVTCTMSSDTTCMILVARGGTMSVTAEVNGRDTTASLSVKPEPCPLPDSLTSPLDSLLNQESIRKLLYDLYWASNPRDPDVSHRMERLLFAYDSSGTMVINLPLPDPRDGPCQAVYRPPNPEPGSRKFMAHPHPLSPNPFLGDTMPDICKDSINDPTASPYGGFSPQDWETAERWGHPHFAIDSDSIYGGLPPSPSNRSPDPNRPGRYTYTGLDTLRKSWPRRRVTCTLIP